MGSSCDKDTPEVEELTIDEFESLDTQPVLRPTPEYSLWLGCKRYVLYLRVRIFEKSAKGRWRAIDGLKPFRVHFRQDCALPRLIMLVRRKCGMKNDVWKLTRREFGDERVVCQFEASGFCPRKIECVVLERTRALCKKQGRRLVALINQAIREKGIAVLEEDESVRKMTAELLFNGYLLEKSDYRKKDNKKICTFRAIDLDLWNHDGRRRERVEGVIRHALESARREKSRQVVRM